MDERTLTALRGSIEKWRKIVAGTGKDLGCDDCPLCGLFLGNRDGSLDCTGCPVRGATANDGCHGLPYMTMWMGADDEREQKIAARAELDFLIGLLPEGVTP